MMKKMKETERHYNLNKLKVEELASMADRLHIANNHLRRGQCFFIVLETLYPGIADEIRGSNIDPFHHDSYDDCVKYINERYVEKIK